MNEPKVAAGDDEESDDDDWDPFGAESEDESEYPLHDAIEVREGSAIDVFRLMLTSLPNRRPVTLRRSKRP